jgi:hypothetical protein
LLNGAATQLAHEYNTVEKKLDLDCELWLIMATLLFLPVGPPTTTFTSREIRIMATLLFLPVGPPTTTFTSRETMNYCSKGHLGEYGSTEGTKLPQSVVAQFQQ